VACSVFSTALLSTAQLLSAASPPRHAAEAVGRRHRTRAAHATLEDDVVGRVNVVVAVSPTESKVVDKHKAGSLNKNKREESADDGTLCDLTMVA
jgi:hypothetical protein